MAGKRVKYWVKMMLMEGTESWIMKCSQIGEAKLFGYILSTFNRTDGSWTNTKEKRKAIRQLIHIEESTIFNYLKHLTKNGLLIKTTRSEYKVSEEYIQFGAKTGP